MTALHSHDLLHIPISRKAFLIGSGSVGLFLASANPAETLRIIENLPGTLDSVASYFDTQAINTISNLSAKYPQVLYPRYPLETIGQNPQDSGFHDMFKKAIEYNTQKGITPFWYLSPHYVDFSEFNKQFPSILDIFATGFEPTKLTYLAEITEKKITNMKDLDNTIRQAFDLSTTGLSGFFQPTFVTTSSFYDIVKHYLSDKELQAIMNKGDLFLRSLPNYQEITKAVKDKIMHAKQFVEKEHDKLDHPVQMWVPFAYFIENNQGDLVKAVSDTYIFFHYMSRNSFDSGLMPSDNDMYANGNDKWMIDHIQDTFKFGNIQLMPSEKDRFNYDELKILKNKLIYSGSGTPQDFKYLELLEENSHDISRLNLAGSFYHFFNTLMHMHYVDPFFAVNGSIGRVIERKQAQGNVKLARTISSAGELLRVYGLCNSYVRK
jgi:hypothetical protein